MGDDEGICHLVQLGAKRQLKDYKGQTALHKAAAAGHTRAAELLLEMGADINATDKAGWTAASHAEYNNHFELADRLVKIAKPIFGSNEKRPKYLFLRNVPEQKQQQKHQQPQEHFGSFFLTSMVEPQGICTEPALDTQK